jgi:hypothetical protein
MPELCGACGRYLTTQPGDLQETCSGCQLLPAYCMCEHIAGADVDEAPLPDDPFPLDDEIPPIAYDDTEVAKRERVAASSAALIDEGDEINEAELPGVPPFPHHLARGPLHDLMEWADRDGLPVSYMAVAGETAIATACSVTHGEYSPSGDGAVLRLTAERNIYPVLWQVLVGESGSGKNPPLRDAFKHIAKRDSTTADMWEADPPTDDEGKPKPLPPTMIKTSTTIESIARWLASNRGAGVIKNGELAAFVKGLGQYKGGGGSDRYDAMDMWSGERIVISRVGDGGNKNAVNIRVDLPRMSVVGGLTPDNISLLGNESDGLRARFLPCMPSSEVRPNFTGSDPLPRSWEKLFDALHSAPLARTWELDDTTRQMIIDARGRWEKRRRDGSDPKTVQTALAKADEQALRLALVAAESESPGQGGSVPVWAMEYAIARVNYAIDCWLALGSDQVMAFSRKDEELAKGVSELLRRIESRTPDPNGRKWMTRTDIARAKINGARTPGLVDQLIMAYSAEMPGTVHVYSDASQAMFPRARLRDRADCPAGSRGPAPVVIYAPLRGRADPN